MLINEVSCLNGSHLFTFILWISLFMKDNIICVGYYFIFVVWALFSK